MLRISVHGMALAESVYGEDTIPEEDASLKMDAPRCVFRYGRLMEEANKFFELFTPQNTSESDSTSSPDVWFSTRKAYQRAAMLYENESYDAAIIAAKKVRPKMENYHFARILLAQAYVKLGDFENAKLTLLSRQNELSIEFGIARQGRGFLLHIGKVHPEASSMTEDSLVREGVMALGRLVDANMKTIEKLIRYCEQQQGNQPVNYTGDQTLTGQ